MELLDRYLADVGRNLPRRDRDDILAELRSLLQDQLDDRAAAQPDRQPSVADLEALLREFGSPRQVAASYGGDRYLIGPALYPTLMMVLRIGLIVTGILFMVGLFASIGSATTDMLGFFFETIAGFVQTMLAFVGMVVIIFAVLEASDVKIKTPEMKPWDPQMLPAVNNPGRAQRVELFIGIAFALIYLLLLNYFRQVGGFTYLINPSDPGLVVPIAAGLLIAMMGIVFAQIVVDAYVFQVGYWQFWTQLIRAGLDLASVIVSYYIFLQLAHGIDRILPAGVTALIPSDRIIGLFFTFVIAATLLGSGVKLGKLVFYRPLPPKPQQTPAREG